MKKIFIALLFMLSCLGSGAQTIQIPAEVGNSFRKDFPSTANENWQKDGGNYEVNFTIENLAMTAVYSKSGYRKEVKREIEEKELPKPAFDYILKNYQGYKLKSILKSTTDKAVITYEAEINNGSKSLVLVFEDNGKFKKKRKLS